MASGTPIVGRAFLWNDENTELVISVIRQCGSVPHAVRAAGEVVQYPLTYDAVAKRLAKRGLRISQLLFKPYTTSWREPVPGQHVINSHEPEAEFEDRATVPTMPFAEVSSQEKYVPHPPRGPMDTPHYIPEGHELGGVSRLTGADGEIRAEWSKTRVAGADEPPIAVPPDFLLEKSSAMRRGDGSIVVQWSSYKKDAVAQWDDAKAAVQAHVAEYVRPASPVLPEPKGCDSDMLTIYPLGDPHIGMLAWCGEVGESFDLKIAERELCECFRQLVARSAPSKEAIVCNLGDFWHAQDDSQRTPQSGNKLDVDGRAAKVIKVGLTILRTIVDTALTKHELVRVRSIPGNHDPHSAFWIPLTLQETYKNEPRVIVEDGFSPYQYDKFGKVLLGWAHGDGCKIEALGEVMATDVPELWGETVHREWQTGHIHHLVVKELRGCVVRSHRTLAGRDAWHHHSGYRSGRSLQALTYHREYGLDSIANVGVERVRAAIENGCKE